MAGTVTFYGCPVHGFSIFLIILFCTAKGDE